MSPTWQEVEAAKAAAAATDLEVSAVTQTLPPGYIKGFDLTIDGDTGALTIDAGFADVNGVFVRRNDTHIVLDEDYNVLELASMRYYIYITKEAKYWIDVVAPEYSTLTFGNYHPEFVYRYIAEFYMDADKKISVANSLEKNPGQIVVVASSAYKGLEYDRICDGTRDEVEINAAITYLSETYGGGTVELTEGTFYAESTITLKANIVLRGRGWSTIIEKNVNDDNLIYAEGTFGSEIDNIAIENLQITVGTANLNNFLWFKYCDNLTINNIFFNDCGYIPVYVRDAARFVLSNCYVYKSVYECFRGYDVSGMIRDNFIDGVLTENASHYGIRITGSADKELIIKNNTIKNLVSTTSHTMGIETSNCTAIITGNTIINLTCGTDDKYAVGIRVRFGESQVLNNYIDDCDNTGGTDWGIGIEIAADDCQVINNYIKNCSGMGISTEGDGFTDRTLVNNNFCQDNGADAGITNENEDNFYDRGTDTMVTANSWQEHTGNADNNGQRVMNGLVDAHGDPAFLSEENVGNVSLMATTTPTLMSFANGWDGDSAANFMKQVAADVEPAGWKNLLGLTRHFLYADYSAGAVTYGKTTSPPVYSRHFHATHRFCGHSLLHFEEDVTPLDEYTNSGSPDGDITWVASGAARSAVQKKWGTYSYLFDGANDYIETTDITNLQRPFTIELQWFTTDVTQSQWLLGTKTTDFLWLLYDGNDIRLYAGTTDGGWQIANSVSGVKTFANDTWYKTTLEWDGAFYRVYHEGVLDIEVASAVPIGIFPGLMIGNQSVPATEGFLGYIDEFRATIGNCRYGTAHAVETAAFSPDAQWFDTQGMKCYEGSPASWTEKKRLVLGEADADRRVGALLHLNGTDGDTDWTKLIDEYGNKWTFAGTARLEEDDGTNTPKFGSTFLWLDGNSDYIVTTNFKSFGTGSWCAEAWWHTRDNTQDSQVIFSSTDDTHGMILQYDAANGSELYLSSDGANWDIANADQVAWTPTDDTWYHIAIEFDGSSYKVYIDGVLFNNIADSTVLCAVTHFSLGARSSVGWANWLNGGIDEFRLTIGHVQHGAAFTPAIAEFATEGTIDTCVSKMLRNTMDSTFDTPGILTMIPEEKRPIGWDVSVNPTTTWTSIDLSKICPPGVKAVYGFVEMIYADAQAFLCTRCSCSEETSIYRTLQFSAKSNVGNFIGVPMMFSALHGKFDIREYDATTEISSFRFRLFGWYRR